MSLRRGKIKSEIHAYTRHLPQDATPQAKRAVSLRIKLNQSKTPKKHKFSTLTFQFAQKNGRSTDFDNASAVFCLFMPKCESPISFGSA